MSKQDYELIARVFAGVNPDSYISPYEIRAALLHQLALELRARNPAFNIVMFMRAAKPRSSIA